MKMGRFEDIGNCATWLVVVEEVQGCADLAAADLGSSQGFLVRPVMHVSHHQPKPQPLQVWRCETFTLRVAVPFFPPFQASQQLNSQRPPIIVRFRFRHHCLSSVNTRSHGHYFFLLTTSRSLRPPRITWASAPSPPQTLYSPQRDATSPASPQKKMAEEEKKRFLDGNEMELGEKQGRTFTHAPQPSVPRYNPPSSNWQNNPILPVISYCGSSILMTVANKYILSFPDYNLNFFLLAVQVCEL